MSSRNLVAVVMIALGIFILAYSGIAFRTRGETIDIGPVHVQTTRSHFIPPVVGLIVFVGGIVLLLGENKKN